MASQQPSSLTYSLSFPEPHTHYVEVKIRLENWHQVEKTSFIDLKMASWTPGSYLIREYARNVESFAAFGATGQNLPFRKINKNTWRVELNTETEMIEITYRVYAFEMSVRTSFVDDSQAYLNGASIFLYPAAYPHLSSALWIESDKKWKNITTALPKMEGEEFAFFVEDFDTLADSPILIGNQLVFEASLMNIPHTFAFEGIPRINQKQLLKDMEGIVAGCAEIFGEHPCDRYTFITHFHSSLRGGLEHLYSTGIIFPKNQYRTAEGYKNYLSLLAHEYFHLWNVKRLRPAPLGPFDYDNENYTTLLWQAEGFTSYYEKLILFKTGLLNESEYLDELAKKINAIENLPGVKVQSLAEASWDTWIKFYRPNENSDNSTISYYTKGAVIAFLLDIEIIEATNRAKSLDDLMRLMYQKYYKKLNRGFTEEEIKKEIEEVCGRDTDDFFIKLIYSTHTPDYFAYAEKVGLQLINEPVDDKKSKAFMGFVLNGKVITYIKKGNAAWEGGLNVNDELLAANGESIDDFSKWLETQQKGTKVRFLVRRNGSVKEIFCVLGQDQSLQYKLVKTNQPTPQQSLFLQKLLRRDG